MHRSGVRSTVIACVVAAAVPVSLVVGTPAMAVVSGAGSRVVADDAGGVTDAQWAPDEASAEAIAAQFGHPVAVDADASPTELVSAMPDGTMQLEVDAVPQRVKQGSAWVGIDTTLDVDSAGWFAPKASAAPVEFSVGGTDVIDRVQTDSGAWVTETWPYGDLPSPVVEGSSVTYPAVLPGVDLRLTAAPGGVSEVLIVADATAAANPQLSTLHLGVPDASVSVNTLAQARAVKSDGSSVVSAAPTWWDSSDAASGPGGPGGDAPPRPLGDATSGSDLTLDVADALAGSSPVFPVFIDPEWSPSGSPYWFTDAAFPNQSYLNGNYADGIQAVGVSNPYRSDAFWQFSLTKVKYTHIIKAVMNTTQIWSATCSPSAIDVHAYGPKTAGFTWNQEQSWSGQWGGILQSRNDHYGCSGVAAHAVGWTVTSAVASKAAAGSSYIQLALTYHNGNLNNSRRHFKQAASLTISYDAYPSTASSLKVADPQRGCGTAANPAYVNNSAQPIVLSAMVADSDSPSTLAGFYVVRASDGSAVISHNGSSSPPSSPSTWQIPTGTLSDGVAYKWRALGYDGTVTAHAYSGWCYITDDSTPPTLTSVNIVPGWAYQVGTLMFIQPSWPSSDTDLYALAYWWTDGDATVAATPPVIALDSHSATGSCPTAAGQVQFQCPSGAGAGFTELGVAPIDRTSTLWVAAYDLAGNVMRDANGNPQATPVTVYSSEDPSVSYATGHGWLTSALSGTETSVPDANTTSGSMPVDADALTLAGSTTLDSSGAEGTALSFPGTQTVATQTSHQDVDTTRSFTVSAWLTPGAVTDSGIYTAVSESGPVNSGFYLQVNKKRWSFCVRQQTPPAAAACAMTGKVVETDVPVFVTGIWDSANHQARLLVNDSIAAQDVVAHTAATGDTPAAGPTVVGSAVSNSALADPWLGEITDPTLFQGVVDDLQLASLYGQYPPQ